MIIFPASCSPSFPASQRLKTVTMFSFTPQTQSLEDAFALPTASQGSQQVIGSLGWDDPPNNAYPPKNDEIFLPIFFESMSFLIIPRYKSFVERTFWVKKKWKPKLTSWKRCFIDGDSERDLLFYEWLSLNLPCFIDHELESCSRKQPIQFECFGFL